MKRRDFLKAMIGAAFGGVVLSKIEAGKESTQEIMDWLLQTHIDNMRKAMIVGTTYDPRWREGALDMWPSGNAPLTSMLGVDIREKETVFGTVRYIYHEMQGEFC